MFREVRISGLRPLRGTRIRETAQVRSRTSSPGVPSEIDRRIR